jgi:hypothetical protein
MATYDKGHMLCHNMVEKQKYKQDHEEEQHKWVQELGEEPGLPCNNPLSQ